MSATIQRLTEVCQWISYKELGGEIIIDSVRAFGVEILPAMSRRNIDELISFCGKHYYGESSGMPQFKGAQEALESISLEKSNEQ